MTCRDWRSVGTDVTSALYAREIDRWAAELHWDTRQTWTSVESARRAGVLPGLLAQDPDGRVGAWTFYLRAGDVLQIGALVAPTRASADRLLDGILASPEARYATSALVFAYGVCPGAEQALADRGFVTERYRYLSHCLGGPMSMTQVGRAWETDDLAPAARLFARAYPRPTRAQPFARKGTAADWSRYVEQLVTTPGCGTLQGDLSVAVPAASGDRLDGLVLTTRLDESTVHVAQVAVDPDAQRRGLGRRMLRAVFGRARAAGMSRVTLLVADGNASARRLYGTLGFVEAGSFVSAVLDQPRRLTRPALETGGTSTLR